jgi:hypothetical protein
MEVFEIHITGDKFILDAAKPIKTISVDLLKPDGSLLRTEYMTSHVSRHTSYDMCKAYVDDIVDAMKAKGVQIVRVKIECPYYEHYKDQSLYIESHFDGRGSSGYPLSRNQRKLEIMATDREYDKEDYESFRIVWLDETVELCLYDTFVEEDKDWFDLYKERA